MLERGLRDHCLAEPQVFVTYVLIILFLSAGFPRVPPALYFGGWVAGGGHGQSYSQRSLNTCYQLVLRHIKPSSSIKGAEVEKK